MYKELTDIEDGVIYVSSKELQKDLNIPRTTLWYHIKKGYIEAFRFRNRTYFHPENVKEYKKLYKAGLLG